MPALEVLGGREKSGTFFSCFITTTANGIKDIPIASFLRVNQTLPTQISRLSLPGAGLSGAAKATMNRGSFFFSTTQLYQTDWLRRERKGIWRGKLILVHFCFASFLATFFSLPFLS